MQIFTGRTRLTLLGHRCLAPRYGIKLLCVLTSSVVERIRSKLDDDIEDLPLSNRSIAQMLNLGWTITAVRNIFRFGRTGDPWESGYSESFNGKLRDELLNGEMFYMLKGAQILIERWRCHYNTVRPHSTLGYRPPAPETVQGLLRFPVVSAKEHVAAH